MDALGYPDEEVSVDVVRRLEQKCSAVLDKLRDAVFSPAAEKSLTLRFNVGRAAEMIGRTTKSIRDAEKDGRLPPPLTDERGRRSGYSLEAVNRMREVFGTLPRRGEDDEPLILAVQNFKGGVGKSTLVVHLGQYLALKGYRVCIVDCDSQASSTTIFGINPDLDLTDDDTIFPFILHGGQRDLKYALRDTYWPGIKLIPANLGLYNAEYEFAARLKGNPSQLDRLKVGIETISDQFDVILLDPPPALGMISLSVLRAANALLIPVPPSTVDFSSTVHFLSMLTETLEVLERVGLGRSYKFMRAVATKMDERKSAHTAIARMMLAEFGQMILDTQIKDSAEIDNATARLSTIYELDGPITSRETHDRCRANLDAMMAEVELLMRKTWPSHRDALRRLGLA
jgi:chromosome partitioning protein